MVAVNAPLWRRALAELLGTGLLVTIVIGSGIVAERLSPGDVGLELFEHVFAIVLGLAVLILLLAPVSGAHFNPLVTVADALLDRADGRPGVHRTIDAVVRIVAQTAGAIAGALLANAMFAVPSAFSAHERAAAGSLLGEVVATAGLLLVVFGLARAGYGIAVVAPAVAAYVGAAIWATSSFAFMNPSVMLGRMFSDTFAGIAPASVPPFLAAQLIGGAIGTLLAVLLIPRRASA
ncbi:MAG: aquaporin [Microbacteriaceae bacterium]|nr:aquaporin [Microbacteriaceae bacterium]